MKKFLLSIFACGAAIAAIGGINAIADNFRKASEPANIAYEADALYARQKADLNNMINARVNKQLVPEYNWENTDTVSYFAVARMASEGYFYSHEGGDIVTYNMGVCRDGDNVWLSGFCNAYDPTSWSPCHENAIAGLYNAAAGTINIAVPAANFAYTSYYQYDLVAGTFDVNGNMEEAEELVFNVTDDFDHISTTQDFGIRYTYGFGVRYHALDAYKMVEGSPANLIVFDESIDFEQTYPGMPVTKEWRVINAGGTDAEYVIRIDADDDAYTCEEMSGIIPAYTEKMISFTFKPESVGEFEGLATIQTEDANILVQFAGEAIEVPDYSSIVKNGDFRFETGIDFPFEIGTLEHPINGTEETEAITVAKSSTNGKYGVSYLKAYFEVPQGQTGKLSFKGYMINTGGQANWYKIKSSILVDDDNTFKAQYSYTGDYATEHTYYEFGPGTHYLYIHHDNVYLTGYEEDGTYIWDLDLQLEDSNADAAELDTPEIDLGNALLSEGGIVTKESFLVLNNKGTNLLEVLEATSDNDEIKATVPSHKVGLLEDLMIPVRLEAKTLGQKVANITLKTTAGEFTAVVKANVMARPDYSQIVSGNTEILSFEYNEEYPFIIEDGKAYNCTSKIIDEIPTRSSFRINFTVPEGKIATFSWDGHAWGTPEAEYSNGISTYDFAGINGKNPNGNSMGPAVYDNDVDFGSKHLEEEEVFAPYLVAGKGNGYFEFYYYQGGDSRYFGEDRYEVSNFHVDLIDAVKDGVEVLTPEVEFEPVHVGPQRYSTATIKLRNLGSNDLVINDIPASEPFYGIVPDQVYATSFYKTIDIELWFYPTEEGTFEDDLVIKTSAGDVTIHCKGSTLSNGNAIYNGDFEDSAYGWTIFDADGDGETWNLATNLFGERPTYVHSGVQAICSVSQSMSLGAVTPDNWTVSPAITIPEDGGKLTYYVASFSPDAYEEHYSCYIITDYDETLASFEGVEPVIEETIDIPATQEEKNGFVDGWMLREIDLTPYAGEVIWIAFRHHDCTGQYMLRLDDVMVYGTGTGIGSTEFTHGIVNQEIFDVNGIRVNELREGINIIRTTYENGETITSKVIYRK